MFDSLTPRELNELTARLVRGIHKSGQLAIEGMNRHDPAAWLPPHETANELAALNSEACESWVARFPA